MYKGVCVFLPENHDGRSSEHILSENCLYLLCIVYIIDDSFNPVVEETPAMILLYHVGLLLAYFFGTNTVFLQEPS